MSATGNRDEPSIGWMLGTSAWMLLTVVPGPVLAWLGFLIIGVTGRMPRWITTGILLGAAAILARMPFWGQFGAVAVAVVYIAGMLLALAANPQWLRARWMARAARTSGVAARRPVASNRASRRAAARRDRADRTASSGREDSSPERETPPRRKTTSGREPRGGPASSADAEAAELAARAGGKTDAYFTSDAQESEISPPEPVDVNTANARALADLPGMTRSKARRAVKLRDEQGGFRTLDAFAAAAELQPHEIVRLRDVAVCSPPARGRRTFGRRVDY